MGQGITFQAIFYIVHKLFEARILYKKISESLVRPWEKYIPHKLMEIPDTIKKAMTHNWKEFDKMWDDGIIPYDTTGPDRDVVKQFISDLLSRHNAALIGWIRGSCQECEAIDTAIAIIRSTDKGE